MDEKMDIVDDRAFDGWVRCSYPIDFDGDGCDEVLVGAGDGNFMVLKLNPEKKEILSLIRLPMESLRLITSGELLLLIKQL